MKIIDAHWEKRNLGLTCKEVLVSESDSITELNDVISSFAHLSHHYFVFKIPNGMFEHIQLLTENGYIFTEALLEVSLNVNEISIPPQIARFDPLIEYREILDADGFISIGKKIEKGIFNTDRIALNPNFGTKVSSTRYKNWLGDEIDNGAKIYEINYQASPIGFFALKKISEKEYDNFLAGMYLDQNNFGLGFSIITKPVEEVIKINGNLITTHISSNNLQVMRLYFQLGFLPKSIVYVMTKNS